MDPNAAEVTSLLGLAARGDRDAGEAVMPLIYDELRRIAGRQMRREKGEVILQATALVHEAYFQLVQQRSVDWESRRHFFAIASELMRRILVNHARKRICLKRGGGQAPVPLDEGLVFSPDRSSQLVEVDAALSRLAEIDSRQAKIVELRFFGKRLSKDSRFAPVCRLRDSRRYFRQDVAFVF